jgi:hypothetical protein
MRRCAAYITERVLGELAEVVPPEWYEDDYLELKTAY